jgi:hypothetical protein
MDSNQSTRSDPERLQGSGAWLCARHKMFASGLLIAGVVFSAVEPKSHHTIETISFNSRKPKGSSVSNFRAGSDGTRALLRQFEGATR